MNAIHRGHRFVANCIVLFLLVIASYSFLLWVTVGYDAISDWISSLSRNTANLLLRLVESDGDDASRASHAIVSAMGIFLVGAAGVICVNDSNRRKAIWLCGFAVLYFLTLYFLTPLFTEWQFTLCEADGSNCMAMWSTYLILLLWLVGNPVSLSAGGFSASKLIAIVDQL